MSKAPSGWGNPLLGVVFKELAQHWDGTDLLGLQQHVKAVIQPHAAKGHNGGAKTGCHAHKFGLLGPEELVLLPPPLVSLHTQSLLYTGHHMTRQTGSVKLRDGLTESRKVCKVLLGTL